MLLDGKLLNKKIKNNIQQEVNKLIEKPKVIDIVIGDNPSNTLYVNNKLKACESVEILFDLVKINENDSEDNIIKLIEKYNNDKDVCAIMVQLPIPDKFNRDKILNAIDKDKDVDCLTNYNRNKLYNKDYSIIPCTPKAILRIIDEYNISLSNKNVVVIGRGELVGKPLIPLLLDRNANVFICHSKTENLTKYTMNADIIISCANKGNIITKEMVNNNSIIIDAGIFYDNSKLIGNVHQEVLSKVKHMTPTPGGVGPVTVAMFLENVLICYYKIH